MPYESCADYCEGLNYEDGTCRQNTQQCTNNNETYESGGDQYYRRSSADTCCCQPEETINNGQISNVKCSKGFTLIELLLYVSIVGGNYIFSCRILSLLMLVAGEKSGYIEVEQQGVQVMQLVTQTGETLRILIFKRF